MQYKYDYYALLYTNARLLFLDTAQLAIQVLGLHASRKYYDEYCVYHLQITCTGILICGTPVLITTSYCFINVQEYMYTSMKRYPLIIGMYTGNILYMLYIGAGTHKAGFHLPLYLESWLGL